MTKYTIIFKNFVRIIQNLLKIFFKLGLAGIQPGLVLNLFLISDKIQAESLINVSLIRKKKCIMAPIVVALSKSYCHSCSRESIDF